MRLASATCGILLTLLNAFAAERAWKTGTWLEPDGTTYAIESPTDILTGEITDASGTIAATAGNAVQFVVEGQTLFVLDANRTEHRLRLVASAAKYSKSYKAIGGGHFIKSVARGGTQVILEDNSRWDIDPRQHFAVAGWQPDDLISIRREEDDPAYSFEIDNTTQDDGALANYRVHQ